MQKSRIVAIALISIILSSSSFSASDAYVIWSDNNDNHSLLMVTAQPQIYKIKLLDKTEASLIKYYNELSKSHQINLYDGISSSAIDDVNDNGKPYQINLYDGVFSLLINDNGILNKQQNNLNQKNISVGLSDGVGTNTTDYNKENSKIV